MAMPLKDSVREPTRSVMVGGVEASHARVVKAPDSQPELRLYSDQGPFIIVNAGSFARPEDAATFLAWCAKQSELATTSAPPSRRSA